MPIQDLIQVRVFVDGEEAMEYEDPDAVNGENTCVRYIETRPGQKFSIYIELLPGFRICWADALYCLVDERAQDWLIARDLEHDHGTLTKRATLSFSSSVRKDPTTGRHNWYEWAFEGVELVDHHSDSEFLDTSESQVIGSLHVTIYRAKKIKREGCCVVDKNSCNFEIVPAPITELPECMFKGQDMKQTVKYINPQPFFGSRDSTTDKYYFVPKNGPAGEKFHFIFKHRDKKALQSLGCIPRDSTPPPDPTLLLDQYERALKLKKRKDREKDHKIAELEAENRVTKREVTKLAHQMALLFSGRTAEATHSPDESTILTPTTSSSEINDTEAIRDFQEITNPNPKPKPEDIIDLTGDYDSD